MKLVDTHCHLDNEQFDLDRLEVINRIKEKLEFCVNIGYDLKSSKKSLELAKEYEFIYAVIGVHPTDISEYNEVLESELEKMA
ncbi:MAG: TatD family hydrolase, partial [Cetobacterium sp.]